MNNLNISSNVTTNVGVLAGKCDENAVFTDNAVSGLVNDVAITLESTMIGSGTPKTHSGTSLYTNPADL